VWSENWVVHQIDDIIRFVDIMVLNKESPNYECTLAGSAAADSLHAQLAPMIENHNFYEAQNFLHQHMDTKNMQHLEVVIDFYASLNQFDDRTLEEGYLIRDGLKAGLCFTVDAFGITIFS
jgi:hypothetical protein